MSEKKFNVYLEFNYSKLNFAAFNCINNKLEFYKEILYERYFEDKKNLNLEKLEKILEENIRIVEKSIKEFIKDVYLIIETPQSTSIKLSVNHLLVRFFRVCSTPLSFRSEMTLHTFCLSSSDLPATVDNKPTDKTLSGNFLA